MHCIFAFPFSPFLFLLFVFGPEGDLCLLAFRFLKIFFRLSFFSFSFLFALVIDLLLGLLSVKKTSKEVSSRQASFTMEQPGVVAGNFALSFSLNFFSIFVHISGSIRPIILIWASLERCFPPAEVEYR